jgi:hypothetical protein
MIRSSNASNGSAWLSPEERYKFRRKLDEIFNGAPVRRRKPELTLVCENGKVVSDVVVVVAPPDPNWYEWMEWGGEIKVKRP